MRAKDAILSTSPRVIPDPAAQQDVTADVVGEGLRALVRALARQAARDYMKNEQLPVRTRSEK